MQTKLIKRIVTFLVLLVGGSVLLNEAFITISRDSSSLVSKYQSFVDSELSQREVIFLGDSHATRSINTGLIPNSFDLSGPGEPYIFFYYRLKYVLADLSKTKYLILPLDLHSLSDFDLHKYKNHSFWRDILDYSEIAIKTEDTFPLVEGFKARTISYVGERSLILEVIGNTLDFPDYQQVQRGSRINKSETRRRVDVHIKDKDLTISSKVEYLRSTVQLAESNGLKVVFVKYPLSNLYLEMAGEYIDLEQLEKELSQIASDSCENCSILDYRNLFASNQELFWDQDHLNEQGAEIFSNKLAKDIQSL